MSITKPFSVENLECFLSSLPVTAAASPSRWLYRHWLARKHLFKDQGNEWVHRHTPKCNNVVIQKMKRKTKQQQTEPNRN